MLVQQINSKRKPIGRFANWTPEFWDKMVKQWGDNLRWIKVPDPVEKDSTLKNITFVSDATNKPIKKKKNERK